MSRAKQSFPPELFDFLRELRRNNRRDWFQANKERYEDHVRHPALQFISDFGPHLRKISSNYVADPRPVGGSMFRIHRDVRFSKDKSPYKTAVGIQFRHKRRKDVHSPGFYLHLEPDGCFAGLGIWHPDGTSLAKIRSYLVEHSDSWQRTLSGKRFQQQFELAGESLTRAPKGYDPDHPLIDVLKLKDFTAYAPLTQRRVTAPGFLDEFAEMCRTGSPLVKFLCEALGQPF